VIEQRYQTAMGEADAAVRGSLARARAIYTDYQERKLTREQAHEQFRQEAKAVGELIRMARALEPPPALDCSHKERLVAYQHTSEGVTDMLAFFDYGDQTWRDFALELWEQAQAELEQLAAAAPGARPSVTE
jgi:hypothetical protein